MFPSLKQLCRTWGNHQLVPYNIHPMSMSTPHKNQKQREKETGPGLLLLTSTLGPLPLLSQHHSCPLLPNHHLAMHASPPRCPACSAWLAFQCDIYSICMGGCFFFSSWLRKQGSVGCSMPATQNATREKPAWSCMFNTDTSTSQILDAGAGKTPQWAAINFVHILKASDD